MVRLAQECGESDPFGKTEEKSTDQCEGAPKEKRSGDFFTEEKPGESDHNQGLDLLKENGDARIHQAEAFRKAERCKNRPENADQGGSQCLAHSHEEVPSRKPHQPQKACDCGKEVLEKDNGECRQIVKKGLPEKRVRGPKSRT